MLMNERSTAISLSLRTKFKEGEALCSSSFAGKVEVDIDGVSQIGTFGNVEKNEYVQFKSAADIFPVNADRPPVGHLYPTLGPFPYTDGDKKITVEVKWTIYQQQPISVVQQDEKIPESLMNQESLSVLGAAIMKDVSTADISIYCDGKSFKAHKAFLCTRLTLMIIILFSLLFLVIQVSCVQSHVPGRHDGGQTGQCDRD